MERDLESYRTPHNFSLLPDEPGQQPFPRYRHCGDASDLAILGFGPSLSMDDVFEESPGFSSAISHFWGPGLAQEPGVLDSPCDPDSTLSQVSVLQQDSGIGSQFWGVTSAGTVS